MLTSPTIQSLSYISNAKTEHVRSRTSRVLARIRIIRLQSLIPAEYMLWQALITLGPDGPLCPNLRELCMDTSNLSLQEAYQVTPLLSSSLRSIALYDSSHVNTTCIILDTLRSRQVDILNIHYEGKLSDHIIERALGFPNLISVSFLSHWTSGTITKEPITPFLGSLTTLALNINYYHSDVCQKLGKWFETLRLTSLTLRGSLENIHDCIHNLNPITSICSFGLCRKLPSQKEIPHLIPLLLTIFPNLHSLRLEDLGSPLTVTLDDLMSFRQKPLQALDLINCLKSTDFANDIVEILRVWPTLERLWIEDMPISAHRLPLISCSAPSLRDLGLSLHFPTEFPTGFLPEYPYVWSQSDVVCPLEHLIILCEKPVLNFCQTLDYARKLIELFPRLRTISLPNSKTSGLIRPKPDLHMAINTLQDAISSPPKRSDRLFI